MLSGNAGDGQMVSLYQALVGNGLRYLDNEGEIAFTLNEGQNAEYAERILPSEYIVGIDGQTYLLEIPFEEVL